MNTTKHISGSATVLFLLFMMIAAVAGAQTYDEITTDYTGWNVSEAFADLARKGKFNIVGKFPADKIAHYRLRSKTYIEEAMNLLARSNGMTMRKYGEIWVAVPDAEIKMHQARATVLRQIELRPAQSLLNPVKLQAMPGVSVWCPPHSNTIALSGSKTAVDESKKLIETLDTPRHALVIKFSLQSPSDSKTIAACTFLAISNNQFRLSYKAQADKTAFNCTGRATINDDGLIKLVLDSEINTGSNRSAMTHVILLKENQASIHPLNSGNNNLRASWQVTPVIMRGRLAPLNSSAPARTDDATTASADSVSATEDQQSRHYTEITPPTAPLLSRPITIMSASLPESLQKIADEADIQLLCDSTVSGTVSAFCFAERLDRDELIEAMAKVCGYDAFKNRTGYVIGKRSEVNNMRLEAENAWVSPAMVRIAAPEAARMLQSWFKEAKITGKITEKSANQLKVIAEPAGTGFAKSLCAIWARDYAKFSAGLILQQGSSNTRTDLVISKSFPTETVQKNSNVEVRSRLAATLADTEEGLLQVDYQIDTEDKARNSWSLKSSSLLPESKILSLVRCTGKLPFQIDLSGNFSLRPHFLQNLAETNGEWP